MSVAKTSLASASTIALLAALGGAGHAQTVTLPLPEERPHVDQWGVDLTSGAVQASEADLSIGAKGTVGLAHTRTWAVGASANGWRHSYLMTATEDNSGHATLAIGHASYGFTLTSGTFWSGTFSSDQGDGASLTSTSSGLTYTGRDGTQIIFSTTPVSLGASYYGTVAAVATQITSPTNVITTLTYLESNYPAVVYGNSVTLYATRLQSVNISTGYQLKYTYATNNLGQGTANSWMQISQVMAINSAVDYCNPTANSCSGFSQSWPTVSYSLAASGSNTVESVTDPQGRVRKNTWDPAGRLLGIQRPTASSTSLGYAYDANNRVLYVNASGIGYWTYAFSTAGGQLTASVTTPSISTPRTVVSLTATHQVMSDTDENGWKTSYTQDTYGRITNITAPVGNQVGYAYDARGNLLSTTAIGAAGGGSFTASSANYTTSCSVAAACNKPTTTTDGDSNVTSYYYNNDGTVSYAVQPSVNGIQPQQHYTYAYVYGSLKTSTGGFSSTTNQMSELQNSITCRTTAWPCAASDQVVTTYAHQGGSSGTNLQLTGVTVAAGDNSVSSASSYGYDPFGNTTSTTDNGGNVSTATYNAARQPLTMTSPLADSSPGRLLEQVQYAYQGDGLVSSVASGTVTTSGTSWTAAVTQNTGYDSADRKSFVEVLDSGGNAQALTQYSYSPWNRPLCVAQRMNPSAFSTSLNPCTLGTQGANGSDRITFYAWENAGLPSQEIHGYGTGFQQNTVSYSHTTDDRLATLTDAKGNVTSYVYDAFERLVRTCYNSSLSSCQSSPTNYDAYAYDNAGNRTSHVTRAGQTFSFTYDALNWMATKVPPSGPATGYVYDLQGRLTSASFYDGSGYVSAGYDGLGRQVWANSSMGGVVRSVGYQYDVLSDVALLTHPDGFSFSMTYDNLRRIGQAWWNNIGGGSTSFFGIAYDNLGRRTTTTRGSNSTTYGYDTINRPTAFSQTFSGGAGNVTQGLGYDAASEIVSQTRNNDDYRFAGYATVNRGYTANALNQYVAAGSASFAYDGNGNLTSDGTNTYAYDAENRLISASTSGGTTLTYDPLGRLFQTSSPTYGATQFVYDGQHVVIEYNGANGAILRRFFWGPGADEPILQDEGGAMNCSGTNILQPDNRGSIIATANCSGNRVNVDTYDEYGIPGSSNWGRFQYTGQAWIPDLGMNYYKARLYSPTLGRFMQTDPIGYGDGPNWYAYAHNNPINSKDPSGMVVNQGGSMPTAADEDSWSLGGEPGVDDGTGSIADYRLAEAQADGTSPSGNDITVNGCAALAAPSVAEVVVTAVRQSATVATVLRGVASVDPYLLILENTLAPSTLGDSTLYNKDHPIGVPHPPVTIPVQKTDPLKGTTRTTVQIPPPPRPDPEDPWWVNLIRLITNDGTYEP